LENQGVDVRMGSEWDQLNEWHGGKNETRKHCQQNRTLPEDKCESVLVLKQ
jgi:hypothetical protein